MKIKKYNVYILIIGTLAVAFTVLFFCHLYSEKTLGSLIIPSSDFHIEQCTMERSNIYLYKTKEIESEGGMSEICSFLKDTSVRFIAYSGDTATQLGSGGYFWTLTLKSPDAHPVSMTITDSGHVFYNNKEYMIMNRRPDEVSSCLTTIWDS